MGPWHGKTVLASLDVASRPGLSAHDRRRSGLGRPVPGRSSSAFRPRYRSSARRIINDTGNSDAVVSVARQRGHRAVRRRHGARHARSRRYGPRVGDQRTCRSVPSGPAASAGLPAAGFGFFGRRTDRCTRAGRVASLFRSRRGRPRHRLANGPTGRPADPPPLLYHASFSPGGDYLATATIASPRDEAPIVRIWNLSSHEVAVYRSPTYVQGLRFSPDGRRLAVACVGETTILDVHDGKVLRALKAQSCAVSSAFSPDGRLLAAAYQRGWPGLGAGLLMWNLETGQPAGDFRPAPEYVFAAALLEFVADGRALLSLDRTTNEVRRFTPPETSDAGTPLAASRPNVLGTWPALNLVATANAGGALEVWNILDGRRRWAAPSSGEVKRLQLSSGRQDAGSARFRPLRSAVGRRNRLDARAAACAPSGRCRLDIYRRRQVHGRRHARGPDLPMERSRAHDWRPRGVHRSHSAKARHGGTIRGAGAHESQGLASAHADGKQMN